MIGLFVCCGLADRCRFDRGEEGDVEFLVVYMKEEDYSTLTCQVMRATNVVSFVCSLLSTILIFVCQFHCLLPL
jgi:hypothetical protein